MQCDECGAKAEGEGTCFCSQCGHEFTTITNVILCPGTKNDGFPCKTEIHKKSRFCGKCGTKVEPQWFLNIVITCQSQGTDGSVCGNILNKADEFCTVCGTRRPTKLRDPVDENEFKVYSGSIADNNSGKISSLSSVQKAKTDNGHQDPIDESSFDQMSHEDHPKQSPTDGGKTNSCVTVHQEEVLKETQPCEKTKLESSMASATVSAIDSEDIEGNDDIKLMNNVKELQTTTEKAKKADIKNKSQSLLDKDNIIPVNDEDKMKQVCKVDFENDYTNENDQSTNNGRDSYQFDVTLAETGDKKENAREGSETKLPEERSSGNISTATIRKEETEDYAVESAQGYVSNKTSEVSKLLSEEAATHYESLEERETCIHDNKEEEGTKQAAVLGKREQLQKEIEITCHMQTTVETKSSKSDVIDKLENEKDDTDTETQEKDNQIDEVRSVGVEKEVGDEGRKTDATETIFVEGTTQPATMQIEQLRRETDKPEEIQTRAKGTEETVVADELEKKEEGTDIKEEVNLVDNEGEKGTQKDLIKEERRTHESDMPGASSTSEIKHIKKAIENTDEMQTNGVGTEIINVAEEVGNDKEGTERGDKQFDKMKELRKERGPTNASGIVAGTVQAASLHETQSQMEINKTDHMQTTGEEKKDKDAADEIGNEIADMDREEKANKVKAKDVFLQQQLHEVEGDITAPEMTRVDETKMDNPGGSVGKDGTQEESVEGGEKTNKENMTRGKEKTDKLQSKGEDTEKRDAANKLRNDNEETRGKKGDNHAESKREDFRKVERNKPQNNEAYQGGHEKKSYEAGEGLKDQDTNNDNTYFGVQTSAHRNPDYFRFHFHVLVSPDFKLKPEKHNVYIQISCEHTGCWTSHMYRMNIVRQVNEYTEMQIFLHVDRQIVFERGFHYLYGICNKKKKKMKWENYYKSDWRATEDDRYCCLSVTQKNKSEHHQYDGIINPDIGRWESVKNTFKGDYIRKLEEDAKISAELFTSEKLLPTRNMALMLDPETLNMLDMLLLGLKKRYLHDAKCWSSEVEFREMMGKAILSHLFKSLESEAETPLSGYIETEQQAERRMQTALFVLTVIGCFKFPLSPHNKSLLARSLLLRPHHHTRVLHDLAVVLQKSQEEKG